MQWAPNLVPQELGYPLEAGPTDRGAGLLLAQQNDASPPVAGGERELAPSGRSGQGRTGLDRPSHALSTRPASRPAIMNTSPSRIPSSQVNRWPPTIWRKEKTVADRAGIVLTHRRPGHPILLRSTGCSPIRPGRHGRRHRRGLPAILSEALRWANGSRIERLADRACRTRLVRGRRPFSFALRQPERGRRPAPAGEVAYVSWAPANPKSRTTVQDQSASQTPEPMLHVDPHLDRTYGQLGPPPSRSESGFNGLSTGRPPAARPRRHRSPQLGSV